MRAGALLAEKVPEAADLLTHPAELFSQGGKVQMLGRPRLLAGGLVGEKLPFPIPQRRGL